MNKIIYKSNNAARPKNNLIQSILFKLNKIWWLRRIKLFKTLFCKYYYIPSTTSFNENFNCTSSNLSLGENVGLADTFIVAHAHVTIGSNCSFSYRNMIITSSHDFSDFSTVTALPVIIGNNVWVTSNVTILPGVRIGDNSVIGAGSVVTKDIPSGVFAAGNPCKVVKKITFVK